MSRSTQPPALSDQPPGRAGAPGTATAVEPVRPPALDLSTAKVGASALTAITTALAASFLGTAGTVIGAAAGAVISTVATALWTASLQRTGHRMRRTGAVLVSRVPAASRTRNPAAVPTNLQEPVEPQAPPPVAAAEPGEPADVTVVMPAVDPEARTASGSNRRRLFVLAALAAGGFVLAMAGIFVAEAVIGHPVSGGTSGTTLGDVTGTSSGGSSDEQDEQDAPEAPVPGETGSPDDADPTPSPSGSPEATEGADDADPTPSPTDELEPTPEDESGQDGEEPTTAPTP